MSNSSSKKGLSWILLILWFSFTAWKMSKYGVISGPYFPVFNPNTGKYRPEITPYLDTFHVVFSTLKHRNNGDVWKLLCYKSVQWKLSLSKAKRPDNSQKCMKLLTRIFTWFNMILKTQLKISFYSEKFLTFAICYREPPYSYSIVPIGTQE